MNTISFLPLALLLCNSCLATFVGNMSSTGENQLQSNNENNKNKTKFIDINMDVQFLILKHLSLMELISLVEAIPQSYSLALKVIRHNNYEIVICHNCPNIHQNYFENNIVKSVEIYNLDLILNTLKMYGSSIQQIVIRSDFSDNNGSMIIGRCINEYSSESLVHLRLGEIKEDTFARFTLPFKNLEHLTFTVANSTQFKNGSLPMNQLFPKLRRLTTVWRSNVDYSFIDCHFPQLEWLYFEGSMSAWQQREQIESILKKNHQIRSISVRFFPKDFIKILNKALPNIESLSIDRIDVGTDAVHMANVNKFVIFDANSDSIRNLSFPKLESLELKYSPEHLDAWMEFFRKHQNLTKLYVFHPLSWQTVQLTELTKDLTNLHEVRLGCTNYISFEAISRFIDDHKRLMTFRFSKYRFNDEDWFQLRHRFENEWNFELIDDEWVLNRMSSM